MKEHLKIVFGRVRGSGGGQGIGVGIGVAGWMRREQRGGSWTAQRVFLDIMSIRALIYSR